MKLLIVSAFLALVGCASAQPFAVNGSFAPRLGEPNQRKAVNYTGDRPAPIVDLCLLQALIWCLAAVDIACLCPAAGDFTVTIRCFPSHVLVTLPPPMLLTLCFASLAGFVFDFAKAKVSAARL